MIDRRYLLTTGTLLAVLVLRCAMKLIEQK